MSRIAPETALRKSDSPKALGSAFQSPTTSQGVPSAKLLRQPLKAPKGLLNQTSLHRFSSKTKPACTPSRFQPDARRLARHLRDTYRRLARLCDLDDDIRACPCLKSIGCACHCQEIILPNLQCFGVVLYIDHTTVIQQKREEEEVEYAIREKQRLHV